MRIARNPRIIIIKESHNINMQLVLSISENEYARIFATDDGSLMPSVRAAAVAAAVAAAAAASKIKR